MNGADLIQALGGRWRGTYGIARCPAHADRSPSLSVKETEAGKVLVKCHAGCDQQRVIDSLRSAGLWSGTQNSGENRAPILRDNRGAARRTKFVTDLWRRTWEEAGPAVGSPIENWLKARRITLDAETLNRLSLRWNAKCPVEKTTMPAMVALMTDPRTAEPTGIHRTFLTADGSAKAFAEGSRKMLGTAGVIRLSPNEEVTHGLGIAEGIESGLSVMATGWRPVWACGSLDALRRFPVLSGIGALTVFSDPKQHEIAGAKECASRWIAAGRESVVRIPRDGDFNDRLGVAA